MKNKLTSNQYQEIDQHFDKILINIQSIEQHELDMPKSLGKKLNTFKMRAGDLKELFDTQHYDLIGTCAYHELKHSLKYPAATVKQSCRSKA